MTIEHHLMDTIKLIADSGSTKTDWCLLESGGDCHRFSTQGINPCHQSEEEIAAILEQEVTPHLRLLQTARPQTLWFYGSGATPAAKHRVEQPLRRLLGTEADITVESDLVGAARALCQHSRGIACILGTGANSCLYDGLRIVANTPALGYILGDEGSGAVLGIRFLNALFKGQLPDELRQEFVTETGLSLDAIIQRVYRQPLANRFLASLSPFIHRHIDLQQVEALVIDHFRQFIRKNIQPYYDDPRLKEALPASPELHVTGSVGFHYQRQLAAAAALEGMRLGRVMGSPMEGLIGYHSSQSSPSTSL